VSRKSPGKAAAAVWPKNCVRDTILDRAPMRYMTEIRARHGYLRIRINIFRCAATVCGANQVKAKLPKLPYTS